MDKEEVDWLLQGERTKGRLATAEEKKMLKNELMQLIQSDTMKELIHLVDSIAHLNVTVVSEDEKTLRFAVEPVSRQEYAETFFCLVEK